MDCRIEVQRGHRPPCLFLRMDMASGSSQKQPGSCWFGTRYGCGCAVFLASVVAQTAKDLPAMLETWVQSLDQENPLRKK